MIDRLAGGMRMVVGDGRIWSVLADQLLLEIRAALVERPRHLRLCVPWLVNAPLHARSTGRYAYTLGDCELRPVTLPQLLERFVEVGGQVDMISRSDAPPAEIVASDERMNALVARAPTRAHWRKLDGARALLVVAPGFGIFAPWRPPAGPGGAPGGTGEVGLLALEAADRLILERGFEDLWRQALPASTVVPDAR